MADRRSTPKRRRKRGHRGRQGRRRLRLVAGISSVLFVLAAGVTLYLYVGVTSRFEGSLWKLPSRIYSDRLVVHAGGRLSPETLIRRLERSGYALSEEKPQSPGQYRLRGKVVQIWVRPSPGSSEPVPDRPVNVWFSGEWIASIRATDGRHLSHFELEPEILATLFGPRQEEREVITLNQVPHGFIRAVLAAEDSRFYSHHGVDFRAVARAALANLRRGRIVQGGSTITQQTVKNLFLEQERTWWRKIREIVKSVLLDLRYPKDRILEVYLNEVYLGQRGPVAICGAQAASRFYFGRDLSDLSLGEWALLAGLIRSPGTYNPFVHPERAQERRAQVLQAMLRLEFIEQDEMERASGEGLRLGSGGGGFNRAPYAVDFVRSQLVELYPPRVLQEEGLSIFTTVNTALQESAEEALGRGLEQLEHDRPMIRRQKDLHALQGAVAVLEPASGSVLAMVGGRDYRGSQFNRAVQARRQPGSCFKPFVYLAAFENAVRGRKGGLTPASLLEDSPVELVAGGKPWRPENYDGRYRGPVGVRQALESSLNVPTVRAAQHVGLERIVEVAERAGFTSKFEPLPSLALGTMEVTPLELATAYNTLAQQGTRVIPRIIREVQDSSGRRVEAPEVEFARSVSPQAAFLVTHLLEGVFDRGTARSARARGFAGRAAGKTGTTDETRDSWFVGYTPDMLALVWVGYDDNARTGLTGASGALPIWVDLMTRAGLDRSIQHFEAPPGIVRREIDPKSGGLAVPGCRRRTMELFAEGTAPRVRCPLHRPGMLRWLRNLRTREVAQHDRATRR